MAKFSEPRNSSIVTRFVGKKVFRYHNVNQYHTTPIIMVANAITSPVFGRSLLLIMDMACDLYFHARYAPTKKHNECYVFFTHQREQNKNKIFAPVFFCRILDRECEEKWQKCLYMKIIHVDILCCRIKQISYRKKPIRRFCHLYIPLPICRSGLQQIQ